MIPKVIEAKYVQGFVIRIRFSDGIEGDVDLGEELQGEVFESLNDLNHFKQFCVHPELHTIIWPNGADFAPEFLYAKIQVLA